MEILNQTHDIRNGLLSMVITNIQRLDKVDLGWHLSPIKAFRYIYIRHIALCSNGISQPLVCCVIGVVDKANVVLE